MQKELLMSTEKRITEALEGALHLPLTPQSRYILMSDCHRGTGNANDNFLKNEYLYLAALQYYFAGNFTYIELGDGDELWENRSLCRIKEAHTESFSLLADFYRAGRLYMLYGNHDIQKKQPSFVQKHLQTCYCGQKLCEIPLFPGMPFYSGIILESGPGQQKICLTHGHQADFLNSTLWKLSRFLVRYLWKPLEGLGIPDPTSAARNNILKKKSEQRLSRWASEHQCLLITGHTHHHIAGTPGCSYLNTGSCVSPYGITGIEVSGLTLTLVKWGLHTRKDQSLQVARQVLGEPLILG